jgi:SAM-dependent methyltransferase
MVSEADVHADAVALPFFAKSFETVTAFQVLEHIAEPSAVLEEIHRVLTPGGTLIMATPFLWGIHDAPRDYYRYTPFGLRHLLERADFDVVTIEPVCGLWAVVGLRVAYRLYRFPAFRPPIMQPLFWILNRVAGWMDQFDFVESDAGGYFTVALRRAEEA